MSEIRFSDTLGRQYTAYPKDGNTYDIYCVNNRELPAGMEFSRSLIAVGVDAKLFEMILLVFYKKQI